MNRYLQLLAVLIFVLHSSVALLADDEAAAISPYGISRPVAIGQVRVTDPFWAPRIETCRTTTLPYCFKTCEETGRISNFAKAAGRMPGKFEGIWFNDSDVYKVIDGAAYHLKNHPDAELEKRCDEVIETIAAAQQDDGYLFCFYTIDNADQRFRNIVHPARHELYCMGHLIEAAAVHHELTGKRNLLDVGTKLADHIGTIFGPGKRPDVPEHQEIELALIKLYRVTSERRYLTLAKFFIDERGNAEGHKLYGPYSQDHLPARVQREIVGHSVRAMYHCAGMADLYLETGDEELLAALRRLWQNTTQRKMYLTGGVGARRSGEAFGEDYELPNATAYAETCAGIGLVLFAHRMLQIEPDAEYADVMERVLYNGFLSSVSLDGTKFFYQNRLAAVGDYRRQHWYGCACCPSNVVRIFPRIGQFAYMTDEKSAYVNLYLGGRADLTLDANRSVSFEVATGYPHCGEIRLTVKNAPAEPIDLCLRIPGWCHADRTPGALYRYTDASGSTDTIRASVNNTPVDTAKLDRGYLRIGRQWKQGDTIRLHLPMPIRRVAAHPNVEADRGRVALQRGPVVYCVEAVDHDGRISHISLPPDAKLKSEYRRNMLGGVTVLTGKAAAREAGSDDPISVDLTAIPYYAWDNREGGEMAVWLPVDLADARPLPKPTIASRSRATASHCWRSDSVTAVSDQVDGSASHDLSVPRLTWWDHRGTKEWVQYDFAETTTAQASEVYWFDDQGTGNCRVPESWRLLYRTGDQWKPVNDASIYGTDRDRYNRVTFEPVETSALRLEVQLQDNYSGGVLEWRVRAVE